jgi:endonuclease/exonuclease/phosphatase family metal-dependent hydrolase
MSEPIRLVTYNIQYSRGKDGEYDLGRIADTVRGADVIGLQEVTRYLRPNTEQDQPAELASLLADYYWVYGAPADVDASIRNDDGTITNRRAQFGNMLLSRWPITSVRVELLPRLRTYDTVALQRGVLEAIVDHPSGPLRVYVVHLDHLLERHRIDEIDHLMDFAGNAARHGTAATGPSKLLGQAGDVPDDFIVMGDCNMLPNSPAYLRMTGEPDYYYGSVMTSDRLVDAWQVVGRDITDGATWWDEATGFTEGTRLDYVFVTPGLAARVAAAGIDDDASGSDHQPVWIDLRTASHDGDVRDAGPDSSAPIRPG